MEHRDTAPDNISVTGAGRIVLDFGTARQALGSHTRSLAPIHNAGFSPEEQYRISGEQGPYINQYGVGNCAEAGILALSPGVGLAHDGTRLAAQVGGRVRVAPHKVSKKGVRPGKNRAEIRSGTFRLEYIGPSWKIRTLDPAKEK